LARAAPSGALSEVPPGAFLARIGSRALERYKPALKRGAWGIWVPVKETDAPAAYDLALQPGQQRPILLLTAARARFSSTGARWAVGERRAADAERARVQYRSNDARCRPETMPRAELTARALLIGFFDGRNPRKLG
jgi:hypothetical protein